MKNLICSTIRGYQADLLEAARGFEAWRTHWQAGQETAEDRGKWDHYHAEFIERGPQWDVLAENPKYDLLRIALDRCVGHLAGHPGPVVCVSLKWAVRILLARPDLVRGTGVSDSLILQVQGITSDRACPDSVSDARWRKLLTLAIKRLMEVAEIRHEFDRCAELMARMQDHPLRRGFLAAVKVGSKMVSDRVATPCALRRLHATTQLRQRSLVPA